MKTRMLALLICVLLIPAHAAIAERSEDDVLTIQVVAELLEKASEDSDVDCKAVYDEDLDALVIKLFPGITEESWQSIKGTSSMEYITDESFGPVYDSTYNMLEAYGVGDVDIYFMVFTNLGSLMYLNINGDALTDYVY